MRDRSRRWLMRLCWGGLLITGAMLIGLRVGRPVYYTDGEREIAGQELTAAGMLVWQTPEVAVELPGPVQGRVAELPDGRLLYGRTMADGTTDLVVFDPARPEVLPEPAYGLNTADNELAPACARDGTIYFASDRPAGSGGYDLYRSTLTPRGFSAPVAVSLCNTAFDETDPAPSPVGTELVFVRIDRQQHNGDDGVLYRCDLDAGIEPAALFERSSRRVVDRDPVYAPDGGALWFVRKQVGVPLRLCRVSLLAGELDAPAVVGRDWGVGRLRGPNPTRDGLGLGLLQPRTDDGGADLWFVSAAREVYPWWLGQRWLEWILLGLLLTCALLLLLLHFGRRWSALDLLAQCLLLSLLLHVLLFLWLMGVEITGALLRGNEDGGSLEVTVVSAAPADAATSSDGQRLASVAAMVQFSPSERTVEVSAPGSAAERAAAAEIDAPDGGYESERTASATATQAALADAAEPLPVRAGVDAASTPQVAALPDVRATDRAAAAAATATAALAAGGEAAVVVETPGGAVGRALAQRDLAAVGAAGRTAAPSPRQVAVTKPAVAADLPAAAALRAATAAAEAAPALSPAAIAATGPTADAAAAATVAARAPDNAAAELEVPAPAGQLSRGGSRSELAPAAAMTTLPVSAPSRPAAVAVALQDRPAAAAVPQPVAAADAPQPRIAPRPQPLVGPRDPGELASARAARDGTEQALEIAPLLPGAMLARAIQPAAGPAAEAPALRVRAGSRRPAAGGLALRDTVVAPTASPPAAAGVDAAPAALRPIQFALTRREQPLQAPQRAAEFGAFAAASRAPEPPGSLLERARAAPYDIAAGPLPVVAETAYSNRFGPNKTKALERYGGTAETERAVADGLRYLARIQNRDGSWGRRDRFDDKYGMVYVGKTALCVLAFLGAGHTPTSNSEHSAVVARALQHLLALQDEDSGAFGPSSCYGHGIATYALAECYGITKDQALLRPLERALTWILDHQGPRRDVRNRGGWGYFSPGLQAEDSYARVSVTAWMVMALESARLSGIELPDDTLPLAREYLENAFDAPNGWFRYNHRPSRLRSGWPTLPASTPAGAFCLLLLGTPAEDRMVRAALDFTVERRPREYRRYSDDDFVLRGQGNVYFWYYGTLCCFLAGGEAWEVWNERLSKLLPAAQSKDGSFAPIDVYAVDAGDNRDDRSYTTAMCVLSLEIYYRYFTPLLIGR